MAETIFFLALAILKMAASCGFFQCIFRESSLESLIMNIITSKGLVSKAISLGFRASALEGKGKSMSE